MGTLFHESTPGRILRQAPPPISTTTTQTPANSEAPFPNLTILPQTSFACKYYTGKMVPDPEANCQVSNTKRILTGHIMSLNRNDFISNLFWLLLKVITKNIYTVLEIDTACVTPITFVNEFKTKQSRLMFRGTRLYLLHVRCISNYYYYNNNNNDNDNDLFVCL